MSLERDVQGHDRRSPAPDGPCIASLVRLAASARVLHRAVRGVSPGGHYSMTVSGRLPVAGQARVPSRAEQEAAKLPDDRDKLPVDFREAVGGAGCTRRCRQPGPRGVRLDLRPWWGCRGIHERISPASVETRRPDRSVEEPAHDPLAVTSERISPASVETRRPDRSVEEPAHDPLAVTSQPTLWGHASRVPGRGWRGAVPPLTPPTATAHHGRWTGRGLVPPPSRRPVLMADRRTVAAQVFRAGLTDARKAAKARKEDANKKASSGEGRVSGHSHSCTGLALSQIVRSQAPRGDGNSAIHPSRLS